MKFKHFFNEIYLIFYIFANKSKDYIIIRTKNQWNLIIVNENFTIEYKYKKEHIIFPTDLGSTIKIEKSYILYQKFVILKAIFRGLVIKLSFFRNTFFFWKNI